MTMNLKWIARKFLFFLISLNLLFPSLYAKSQELHVSSSALTSKEIEELGQLPPDWVILPEHMEKSQNKNNLINRLLLTKAGDTFTRIIRSQQDALDKERNEPKKSEGWHLTFINTNLATSFNGVIGILSGRGSPFLQIMWRRKGLVTKRKVVPPLLLPGPEIPYSTVKINEETTQEEANKQFEPIIKSLMKSGKIKDEKELRKNLISRFHEFKKLFYSTGYDPYRFPYYVQQLALEYQVSMGGQVAPFFGIDAIFRLRFEWTPMEDRSHQHPVVAVTPPPLGDNTLGDNPPPSSPVTTLQKNMLEFTKAIRSDLHTATEDIAFDPDFPLNLVIVRFGITASGNIFVARTQASTVGQVTFRRVPISRAEIVGNTTSATAVISPTPDVTASGRANGAESEGTILVDGEHLPEDMEYAKSNKIEYFVENAGSSSNSNKSLIGGIHRSAEYVLYKTPRKSFVQGLRKSVNMARFFTNKAKRVPFKHFELFRIAPGFSLSLGGTFSLVGLNGTTSVQFAFDRL